MNANYKVGTNSPGVPDKPRYGPFADSTLQQKTDTLEELGEKGIITEPLDNEADTSKGFVLIDPSRVFSHLV